MSQKERIIDQAMQMFVAQGIKAVRMDDIAQQLGVSKRTLYEMFGDKEGLLLLAMSRYFEQQELRHKELAADSADMLEALFMVLSNVMDDSQTTNRLMTNLRKFHPAVHDKLMEVGAEERRRSFKECLEKGIEDGLFTKEMNTDLAISILYYTASALITRKDFTLPEGLSEREAFVQVVSSFFRGISTAKGLALIDTYKKKQQFGYEKK